MEPGSVDDAGTGGFEGSGLTTMFEGEWATVRRLRKGKLVVTAGPVQGKELEMIKPRVTGGRSIICDLVLGDKAVSGTHFEVAARDDGYRLRDLNSRNGVLVGDLRIREVYLRPGTVFRIGHTQIQFQPMQDVVEIELSKRDRFDAIIGGSAVMREIFASLEKVSPSELTVLITGETGTGKEMVARAIHFHSAQREMPMVKVNCAAIPESLLESELFGHTRGAFTGALTSKKGKFALADGGTIFLDEIGTMKTALQSKLLRVLQEREFEPLGSERSQKVDVRVIAATNRDIRQMVSDGRFQEDLYYRLNVIPIHIPPLRERRDDIALLVDHFVRKHAQRAGKRIDGIDAGVLEALQAADWPGNVRELENTVERAVVLAPGAMIGADVVRLLGVAPAVTPGLPSSSLRQNLDWTERETVRRALQAANGVKKDAAEAMGISQRALSYYLAKPRIE